MRKSEISQLRWDDVNLKSQEIAVLGKGGRRRRVPIHPALAEVLAGRWRLGQRVTPAYHAAVKEIAPEYAFHDFRRTVATSLFVNGVPEPIIDKIMGWSPRTMARAHYFHVAGASLHEAILRLYADDPLG